ncbi:hypothetical protein CEXT_792631 [Caerostris extrusa]|uniref:Uncharacterized protein n=1 Tax=Caerostris extrusa TaxID=172846 RepID=A0AAV4M5D1_CAEEX|nr:hypothetical protein CEXT_792631 [Caerostris extrusa]
MAKRKRVRFNCAARFPALTALLRSLQPLAVVPGRTERFEGMLLEDMDFLLRISDKKYPILFSALIMDNERYLL